MGGVRWHFPAPEVLAEILVPYAGNGVFAKTNQCSRVKISKLWLVIGKLTREKYAGMHADTDNEENNFWHKLSCGILERHRRIYFVFFVGRAIHEFKVQIEYLFTSVILRIICRAGTIRSSAVSIHIWYSPCRYDTYSIRYTCTRLKVSKSRILDFNNKVNVLDLSIHWILQILVLKHNDRFFSTN